MIHRLFHSIGGRVLLIVFLGIILTASAALGVIYWKTRSLVRHDVESNMRTIIVQAESTTDSIGELAEAGAFDYAGLSNELQYKGRDNYRETTFYKTVPVVVMAPRDSLFDKTVSNMQEVMARGGKVLLISDAAGVAAAGDEAWRTITLPEVPEVLTPLLYALPAQLLAYHTAIAKGTDVDQPRNLAKSVTVE